MKGDFDSALERVEEALAYNGRNIEAANLKTSVLRAKGDKKGALECAEKVLAFDPVNAYAAREKQLLSGGKEFEKLMRDDPESYLELAIKYMHNGFDAGQLENTLLSRQSKLRQNSRKSRRRMGEIPETKPEFCYGLAQYGMGVLEAF